MCSLHARKGRSCQGFCTSNYVDCMPTLHDATVISCRNPETSTGAKFSKSWQIEAPRGSLSGVSKRVKLTNAPRHWQDFTLDFYFRQFWTDPRLAFRKRPGVETLSVGSEFIKNIWVPDTFFVNEKQSYFHIATTSNEFIRIHHSGSITRSIRSVPN